MKRPVVNFVRPKHIKDYPVGPCYTAGHLVADNADWRTEKPVLDQERCVNCLVCYLVCPEGVVYKTEAGVGIDYRFCKGCGICARECKPGAISMIREE